MQASISACVHPSVGSLLDGSINKTPRFGQRFSPANGLERSFRACASLHLRNPSVVNMQADCNRLGSLHSANKYFGLQAGKGVYIAKTPPIGGHILSASRDDCEVGAALLRSSQNRSLVQLKQGVLPSAGNIVNNRGSRVCKCCALKEGVDEVASTEGSALSEQGKEKEKIITEGWLEGSAFQIAFVSLCLATALVPVAPKFEFSGQLYMTIIASLTIYVGSHRSLKGQLPSKMTLQNSFAVPFFSSAVLFGFWCLLKYFPDLDLKVVLKSYLFLVGSIAVGSNIGEPLARLLQPLAAIKTSMTFPKWLIQDQGEAVTSDVRATDFLAAAIGIVISVINVFPDAPYSVNNFIAICLVSELLQTLSLGSFVTAAALLAGLLCYDVFWVFGSPSVIGDNVMVTVATSKSFLSSPMMLQFPVLNPGPSGRGFTILGLGDITVPGLLIALALRFDRFRNSNSNEGTGEASTSNREGASGWEWLDSIDDKTYFRTCLAAYCVGLGVTFVANSFSGAAQPALLYLVPAVLCGGSLAAVQRGEFRAVLDYKDRAGTEEAVPEPIEVVDSDKLLK